MFKAFFLWVGRLVFLTLVGLTLAACSSRMNGMTQTAKAIFLSDPDISKTIALNPSFRYLRVSANGRVILLALGYIDAHPLGPVEVWYSAGGEVLRLQQGHIVGLTGADTEWREVRLSRLPAWPAADATSNYTRIRDVMPGYRFGMVDQLQLRAIAAPVRSNLQSLLATDLHWYEAQEAQAALPAARFALAKSSGTQAAVYGEQCIAPTLCLSWQQWPPLPSAP